MLNGVNTGALSKETLFKRAPGEEDSLSAEPVQTANQSDAWAC